MYTTATLVVCKKKKKRMILEDMIEDYKPTDIQPDSVARSGNFNENSF